LGTQRLALERLWDKQDLTRRDQLLRLAILELRRLTSLISKSDPAATRMRAYHQLGRAWKHLGDFQLETGSARETASQSYQAALQAFRQVLRIDPDQVDALGEIVLVYLALDDRLSGLAAVRKHLSATQSPPSRAKTHVMLGELLARNGEFDEAISNLKSAIEADGGAMDAYMVLFRIFAKRNDPESAIRLLRRAVETEPTFLSGHLQLGQLLAGQDRIDEAINSFEALLRVPPTEAVVLGMVPSPNVFRNQLYYRAASWLAWLYLDTNDDPERALQAVKTAKQYGPADAHLLDTEGLIFLKQGEYRKARDLLGQTAKELETPTALYHLAQAHFALGEWYESVKCLQQALAGDTAFADRAAATKLLNQTREKLVSQADRPQP
jgi:superkiller protein 3